jgi:3-oxoacyl-[acyl-carrier-protein] synthase III
MERKVYIGGFSYELGEQEFDIEALAEIQHNQLMIDRLRESGLSKFRTTERGVLEIASVAIRHFLDQHIIAPETVDAVIFCTNSFWSQAEFTEKSLSDFLCDLGMDRAFPIASSFSYCGNFLTGARTACHYIMSGEFTRVLLVVADRTAHSVTRLVPPGISIGSDAASCCLLTSDDTLFELEIESISQSMNAAMGKLDPAKDFKEYTKGVAKGVTMNVEKTLNLSNLTKACITNVISNNYNRWVTPSMIRLADIAVDKLSLHNIGRFAHAGASDICINLADHVATLPNMRDQRLLLLSTGPAMWGSAIVRSTTNTRNDLN